MDVNQTLVFDIPEGWTKLKSLLVAPHEVNTHDNPIPTNDNENHHELGQCDTHSEIMEMIGILFISL